MSRRKMDEEISTELSDAIISSNRKYTMLIEEMKNKYPREVYAFHLEKLAHMMALSFDILDELGKDYPHLNPMRVPGEH
ncbi:MAG: hypothetical protein K1564_11630 [Candidatus Thiodiazotropha sp. (ex. Lucinisca nassula)]|nr:hypothetical protein [Candidatus Thiodiazotropha sp. (ex. Lucinisca nassula)]